MFEENTSKKLNKTFHHRIMFIWDSLQAQEQVKQRKHTFQQNMFIKFAQMAYTHSTQNSIFDYKYQNRIFYSISYQ